MTVAWKVTATTLYCEAIGDDVTIMLYKDGTIKCTGSAVAGNGAQARARRMKDKSKALGRELACLSPQPCAMTSCFENEIRLLGK